MKAQHDLLINFWGMQVGGAFLSMGLCNSMILYQNRCSWASGTEGNACTGGCGLWSQIISYCCRRHTLSIAVQRLVHVVLSCIPCAAVEGSKRMAEAAQSIIEENQLSSSQGGPITVVSGRVEELEALPMQQVYPTGSMPCRKMPS